VLIFGRVAAVERDHQWEPQGASNRQGERAAAAEMGMNQPWVQHCEIRLRRNAAELFEQQPVEPTGGAAPTEYDRLGP